MHGQTESSVPGGSNGIATGGIPLAAIGFHANHWQGSVVAAEVLMRHDGGGTHLIHVRGVRSLDGEVAA